MRHSTDIVYYAGFLPPFHWTYECYSFIFKMYSFSFILVANYKLMSLCVLMSLHHDLETWPTSHTVISQMTHTPELYQ